MCILSYLPAGVDFDADSLENGGLSNPDGHGWAIADNGEMLVGKSLTLADALETFEAARKAHPGGDALFHSRWATHGSIKPANCHPFYVGNSKLTVVGHNGILPAGAHPKKGDDRSDTKLFADEILSTRYRRLDKPRAFEALTSWIGGGNKLVILTVDPRYRRSAYIVNEKAGNWDQLTGMWHSNYDYLTATKWGRYDYGYSAADWAAIGSRVIGGKPAPKVKDFCLMCNYGSVTVLGFCNECGTCQDCFEHKDDCNCYWSGGKPTDDEVPGDYNLDTDGQWGNVTEIGSRSVSDFLTAAEVADLEASIARDEQAKADAIADEAQTEHAGYFSSQRAVRDLFHQDAGKAVGFNADGLPVDHNGIVVL